jgi:UDP-N-acetylmuramoylalanine-D-glutamate ligase
MSKKLNLSEIGFNSQLINSLPNKVFLDQLLKQNLKAFDAGCAFKDYTAEKIRAAVVAAENYDAAKLPVHMVSTMDEAVAAAAKEAVEGDLVLLSPACASFDAFANFAQRGDHFRKIVMELE